MYSEAQKESIVRAMESYLVEKNLSANKFAELVNVSASYLSAMKNRKWNEMPAAGKFVAIDDLYFGRIAGFLNLSLTETFWSHFNTVNYCTIVSTLTDARNFKERRAIDGITGSGKTYSVTQYKLQNPVGTYLVRCSDDLTAKSFMLEMAEVLGLKEFGNRASIRKAIVRKLASEPGNPLLIIDESENLKDGTWGAIKAMCDDLEGKCGVVIVGANRFQETLSRKADRNVGCFPQIYRRFKSCFQPLFSLAKEDVSDVCNELGIRSIGVINWMFDHCSNFGELADALITVQREAKRESAEITPEYCKIILNR